jgi:hypothetical protein
MKRLLAILGLILLPAAATAHPAWGIVADTRGNVFYSDLKQVWMLEPTGRTTVVVPNVHTHELCLDTDDTLYGEHLWYEGDRTGRWGHRVWKRTRDGMITDVIPATEGFRRNYSFVRDRTGSMYWPADPTGNENGARTTIFKRTPDGTVRMLASGFTSIRVIAATSEGIVYALDAGRLQRVAADGSWKTMASDLEEQRGLVARAMGLVERAAGRDPLRHAVMGIWPGANGHVYLANTGASAVKRVSPEGRVETVYRSSAPYSPTGVTVAKDTILVLESALSSARVRRLPVPTTGRLAFPQCLDVLASISVTKS